ncbi:MAG: hypothetical protein KAR80_07995 [Rhodospirillaceae bacterium]|nr:hypothetical protein [Rhodospirillaceae bacterium]
MAETKAQKKWRDKYRLIKTQLNVMARKVTHDGLDEIVETYNLRGKAEAVAFCCYITRAQMQKGWHDPRSKILMDSMVAGFRGQRDIYSP